MESLYEGDGWRRAALAFMRWQVDRGLLDPVTGSPWWRAVNERLLLETALGRAEFSARPTAAGWYRAHNRSVVTGYLENCHLAEAEGRVERFFLNLILVRVLYAHALVAAPGLALSWAAPIARPLGDPRLGMTSIFLSLGRVLPDSYPLGDHLDPYVRDENGFGRLLDIGVIRPRVDRLYDWSADELGIPELRALVTGDVPSYAWDPTDTSAWDQPPGLLARAARRILPA